MQSWNEIEIVGQPNIAIVLAVSELKDLARSAIDASLSGCVQLRSNATKVAECSVCVDIIVQPDERITPLSAEIPLLTLEPNCRFGKLNAIVGRNCSARQCQVSLAID